MTTDVRTPRVHVATRDVRRSRQPSYVAASARRPRRARMLADGPWRRRDRRLVVAGCGGGLIGLAICSYGGSGELDLSEQLHWLLGGILSVAVASLSLAYWLLSGLRAVRIEVGKVLGSVTPGRPVTSAAAEVAAGTYVTVTGMTRFHRPQCPLVAGKVTLPVDGAAIGAAGLRPCGACES